MKGQRRVYGTQPEFLRHLRIGDKVWIGHYAQYSGKYKRDHVAEVIRLTATQIIAQIPGRTNPDHYYNTDGYEVCGPRYGHLKIMSLAGADEVKAHEVELRAEANKEAARIKAAEAIEDLRSTLNELFDQDSANNRYVGVHRSNEDKWNVQFNNLTTGQVRKLAKLTNGGMIGEL